MKNSEFRYKSSELLITFNEMTFWFHNLRATRDFVDVTTTTTRMTWINQHISCHLTVLEATHSSRDRQHVMLPK